MRSIAVVLAVASALAAAFVVAACAHSGPAHVELESWRPADGAGSFAVAVDPDAGGPSAAQRDEFRTAARERCAGVDAVIVEEGAHPNGVVLAPGHYGWIVHCPATTATTTATATTAAAATTATATTTPAHVPDLDTEAPAPSSDGGALATFREGHAKFVAADCDAALPLLLHAAAIDASFAEPMRDIAMCEKKAGATQRACAAAKEFVKRKHMTGPNADNTITVFCGG